MTNMNEAEKESKRLKRILANRASARKTIRQRQALHLDLTRKAAELTEENLKLKEEKKLAMEGYISARDRNLYLKKELVKLEEAESRKRQVRQKSSNAEMSSSATNTPVYPSLVCPSVPPSSDVFQFQHPDLTSSSQSLVPNRDLPCCCSHRNSTPIYILPVPWLLPYQPNPATIFHSSVGANDVQNKISSSQTCSMCSSSDNNHLSFDLNLTAAEMVSNSSKTTCVCRVQGPEGCSVLLPDINTFSTDENNILRLLPKNLEEKVHHHIKMNEYFAASEAQRKRMELMKLKNTPCHHFPTQH